MQNPAQQISQQLSVNKGQLSVILKRFEQAGWLEKTLSETDKRAFHLRLTAAGEAVYQKQLAETERSLQAETADFSAAEQARLQAAATQFQATYTRQNQVEISEGGWQDVGLIADLHCRIYAELGYKATFQPYVLEALSEFIRQGCDGKIWLAKVNGERVGTVTLLRQTDTEWVLRWFVMDSRYQSLGLGKRLMQAVMDFVHSHNIQKVTLGTVADLDAARALYAKHGFVCVASTPNHEWKDEPIVEETWEWQAPSR